MSALVFDIETIGEDFDKMDEVTRKSLTQRIKEEFKKKEDYEKALEKVKDELVFSPLTGEIVAIGALDSDSGQGAVYFRSGDENLKDFEEDGIKFKVMDEKEMLKKFWELADNYNKFVSFNGRGFDVPYLMARSAAHGVKPTKNLMGYRYIESQRFGPVHVDLMDQLTFYGSVWQRKGNFHLWCRTMGIKSPKAEGVNGDDVTRLFKEGKFKEIALYNSRDIIATKELYDKWTEFYNF